MSHHLLGEEPFLEKKRGFKGFFMELGVMNSLQGNKKMEEKITKK